MLDLLTCVEPQPTKGALYIADTPGALTGVAARSAALVLHPRRVPTAAPAFFTAILKKPFGINGKVSRSNALADIEALVKTTLNDTLFAHPFCAAWLLDMADVCMLFADIMGRDSVGFSLSSHRGCKRYHQDKVPLRLLVTYHGRGTEWLPPNAANLEAYLAGADNNAIVKDAAARQWVDPWTIALFSGAPNGLLHRTPDAAAGNSSLLMRLDSPTFWDQTHKTPSARSS